PRTRPAVPDGKDESVMPFISRCPHCQAACRIPDDCRGKKIRCPKCNNIFAAGEPPGGTLPKKEAAGQSAQPAPSASAPTVSQPAHPSAAETPVPAEPNGPPDQSRRRAPRWAVPAGIAAVALVAAVVCFVVFGNRPQPRNADDNIQAVQPGPGVLSK